MLYKACLLGSFENRILSRSYVDPDVDHYVFVCEHCRHFNTCLGSLYFPLYLSNTGLYDESEQVNRERRVAESFATQINTFKGFELLSTHNSHLGDKFILSLCHCRLESAPKDYRAAVIEARKRSFRIVT